MSTANQPRDKRGDRELEMVKNAKQSHAPCPCTCNHMHSALLARACCVTDVDFATSIPQLLSCCLLLATESAIMK